MTHVIIDDIDPRRSYTVGASARSSFAIPFAYFETSNIVVTVDGAALVLDTDYSISGTAADAGFPAAR
jgi:hypothetical protein